LFYGFVSEIDFSEDLGRLEQEVAEAHDIFVQRQQVDPSDRVFIDYYNALQKYKAVADTIDNSAHPQSYRAVLMQIEVLEKMARKAI